MASKTVAIIGARLSSSRLPGKQLLPLAGKPSLSHTSARLRSIAAVDDIILATTNAPINQDLLEWAESEGVVPFAWDGDENDLMGRVDAAFSNSGADRFVYVCGDCALIHPDTIALLIDASIEAGLRGFACLPPLVEGRKYIHEGFDVYNREFWSTMMAVAVEPFEREHVGAVYHHRRKVTPSKIVHVHEDHIFSSVDHRLSVDTRRDYLFMRRLYKDWYAANSSNSLVDLKWVIQRLKNEPDLAAINSHVYQKSAEEIAPRVSILCEAGPAVGLGHLSRACAAAGALQDYLGAAVKLFIRGPRTEFSDLKLVPHEYVDSFEPRHSDADVVICDLKGLSASDKDLMRAAKPRSKTVAIDMIGDNEGLFDRIWMPSVYVDPLSQRRLGNRLSYGLDHFLLRDIYGAQTAARATKRVIILTGGSDPAALSESLPAKLNCTLPAEIQIDWVTGPFAKKPDMVGAVSGRFNQLEAPEDLPSLLTEYDAALCVYGVSFYECLKAQTPVVTFDPIGAAQSAEWKHLSTMLPSFMCEDADSAVEQLNDLLSQSGTVPKQISDMLGEGPENFASMVSMLLQNVTTPIAYDHASNT